MESADAVAAQPGLVGVDRTVSIIEAVRAGAPATLADIARASSLSEPTALRYLSALRKHHIIVRDLDDGTYSLGVRLRDWGDEAPFEVDPRVVATEPLRRLADELGETVELAMIDRDQVVVIAAEQGPHAIGKVASVGEVEYWHSTSVGKSLLAQRSVGDLERILAGQELPRFTERTLTSAKELRADIAATAARGYAVDDEETETGLRCIGVALRARDGSYSLAVSASGPVYRMSVEREREIAGRIAQAAMEIEAALGSTDRADAASGD